MIRDITVSGHWWPMSADTFSEGNWFWLLCGLRLQAVIFMWNLRQRTGYLPPGVVLR